MKLRGINKKYYSLLDLSSKLTSLEIPKFGTYEKHIETRDACIIMNNLRLKMLEYKIKYTINPPIISEIVKDFSKELIGVIEYLGKNYKKEIYKTGHIKHRTNSI